MTSNLCLYSVRSKLEASAQVAFFFFLCGFIVRHIIDLTSFVRTSKRPLCAGDVLLMSNICIEQDVLMSAMPTLTGGMKCGVECYENS